MVYNFTTCFAMLYSITENKCTGCGTCLDVCPTGAIVIQAGHAHITIECIDCGACPRVCPEGAIKQAVRTHNKNSQEKD
jgi:ferredoxin